MYPNFDWRVTCTHAFIIDFPNTKNSHTQVKIQNQIAVVGQKLKNPYWVVGYFRD
jgi:hypothetical protein